MCVPALIPLGAAMMGTGGTIAAGAAAGASATAISAAAAASSAAAIAGTTTALSMAGTALSAFSAFRQSQVAKEVANNNASLAEMKAKDALARGEKDAIEVQRKNAAFKSSQRVGLAAHGLDLTYGSAADMQDQTDFFGQSDIATTRTNARKEAYNARSQGANFQMEASSQNPWMAGGSTLLAGAGSVADKWYGYRYQRAV